jgi:hypothetical protein
VDEQGQQGDGDRQRRHRDRRAPGVPVGADDAEHQQGHAGRDQDGTEHVGSATADRGPVGGDEILTADGFVGLLSESALWMVETIVAGAVDGGCTPEQAVDVFRNIWYYTVGEILVRAHSARRRPDHGRPATPFFGNLDASRMPRLAAVGDRWPTLAARDTYPAGLRAFVDGLLAQSTSPVR